MTQWQCAVITAHNWQLNISLSSHRFLSAVSILEYAMKEQSEKLKEKKLSSTIHDVNDHPMYLQIKTYTF